MTIRELEALDRRALLEFFAEIPEADQNFFKDSVVDPTIVDRWLADPTAAHLVALDDGRIIGHVAIRRRTGLSSHVGEITLIVAPAYRRRGLGQTLARHALLAAVGGGVKRVIVEVAGEQVATVEMFKRLGFEPEALLRDFIRDRAGNQHDLLVLAHDVDEVRGEMQALGIADTTT
jgi:ribosomal protein S18 acetylase RimI-like enzyme